MADEGAGEGREAQRALEAWRRFDEEAGQVEAALLTARDRARVARERARDRRGRGEQARLAGQEAFALGLLDAAEAHELTAAAAEADAEGLAARHRSLRRAADAHAVAVAARPAPPAPPRRDEAAA